MVSKNFNSKKSIEFSDTNTNTVLSNNFLSSSTKWSIKKTYEDSYSKFVPRVDKLARFDPPYEGGLVIRRMYIVYPLAKSILRYINDCEMEFIHYDTDINGANIVTYLELKDEKIVF